MENEKQICIAKFDLKITINHIYNVSGFLLSIFLNLDRAGSHKRK